MCLWLKKKKYKKTNKAHTNKLKNHKFPDNFSAILVTKIFYQ